MISAQKLEFQMSDGVRLQADAYGQGPVLLLAHGAGQTRYSWQSVARLQAEKGWRSVTVDLRGHGDSDWHDGQDYSIERYGHDIAEMAQALGGSVYFVGASLGGNAAIAAAGRLAPHMFRALVLVDVVPQVDATGAAEVLGFMDDHLDHGFADVDEASRAVSAYRKEKPRPRGQSSGLARHLRERSDGRLRWHWDPAFIRGPKQGRLTSDYAQQLEEDLASICCPILLLRGLESNIVTDEAERAFQQVAPRARVAHIGGAGHMVVGDNNSLFAAELERFLQGLRAAGDCAEQELQNE